MLQQLQKNVRCKTTGSKRLSRRCLLLCQHQKSHDADVDPTGEYIVAGGKLASVIAVHSYSKLIKAIEDKANFTGEVMGIPYFKIRSNVSRRSKEALSWSTFIQSLIITGLHIHLASLVLKL